jgi:hypothetical protein
MEREAVQAAAGQEGEQIKGVQGEDSDDEEVDQQQLKNGELEG